MESKGWHIDRHHGRVFSASGGEVTPYHVGAALQEARRKGLLEPPSTESGDNTVAKSVSGLDEAAPTVQHLDLRQ
jgi:hypothetical protein